MKISPRFFYRLLITLCIVLGIGSLLYFYSQSQSIQYVPQAASKPEKKVPYDLLTVDDKPLLYKTLEKNIVLLNYWATWCPPCRVEIPELIKLKERYADYPFEIVGVSMDYAIGDVLFFMNSTSFNYPIVMGSDDIFSRFGYAQAVPTSIILDKGLKQIGVLQGYQSFETLTEVLDPLVYGEQ